MLKSYSVPVFFVPLDNKLFKYLLQMSEAEMAEFFRELAEDRRLRSAVNASQAEPRSATLDKRSLLRNRPLFRAAQIC